MVLVSVPLATLAHSVRSSVQKVHMVRNVPLVAFAKTMVHVMLLPESASVLQAG